MGQWTKYMSKAAIEPVEPCDPVLDVARTGCGGEWENRYNFLRKLDKGLSTTDFSDPEDCPKLYRG